MILILMVEQIVEWTYIAVIRESQMLDASCLTLLKQELKQMIVEEASVQSIHTSTSDAVQQVVVDMIHLKALERLVVHLLCLF